ncbi:endosialidase-like protein [Winogradskyella eximia]|uniref:Endosialidase-like protein n=1 Tax=Winogradskyella eximia TaxID=262006 RepID=A0A3D9H4K1_9FLAO|nr:tail fiber domain-containing protein [Winogradskyella eximia]RED44382.1 endosialidase-like protein [Winogradskyella eximia]
MKTKLLLSCSFTFLFIFSVAAQVGVGNTNPQASLDISASNASSPANNDGILIPRMSAFPSSPGATRDGMLIFYTGTAADGKGFYYWDQTITNWISIKGSEWFDAGTFLYPSEGISEDISIGKTSAPDGKLDILSDKNYGIHIDNRQTGNTNNQSVYNLFNNTANTGQKIGIHSAFWTDTSGKQIGINNTFFNDSAGDRTGVDSQITGHSSGEMIGTFNSINMFTGTGESYGVKNNLGSSRAGDQYAIRNFVGGNSTGNKFGNYTHVIGTSTANYYGTSLFVNGTGTGPKYGVYSEISSTSGGTNNWAGFFIGRVYVGTTLGNGYNLPLTDGSSNQIISTDGSGQLSFVDASALFTNTDDQNLNAATLTGTTLNLSIENGTGTSVNLASLQDGTGTDNQTIDNLSLSGTTLRLSLEDDGQPLQTVNLASLQDGTGTDNQTIDNLSLSGTILRLSLEDDGQPLQTVNLASLQDGTGTDNQNLLTPNLTGTTLNLGIENGTGTSINLATLQDGTGTDDQTIDNLSLSGTTLRLSLENDGQPLQTVNLASLQDGTGTDNQNLLTPNLTGTTLNLGIENGTGTSINLATLQDGTGTDDQTIDNLSLSGTTLRLSLENDGQPLQTVNLASLQDGTGTDDQNIQSLGFNSSTNMLTVGIENGTSQSVNLSALDSGGDIIQVNAGTGLTGGGATGNVTLNAVGTNGLTTYANDIRLGGSLIQNTTITNGVNDLNININSTGTFKVQDAGVNKLEVNAFGDTVLGGDLYIRDENSNSTSTVIARFIDDADDGRLQIMENGIVSVDLDTNSQFVFNEQGLDRNFRIESNANSGMFNLDAGLNRVSIGAVNNAGTFNVTGNSFFSDDIYLRDGSVSGGDILARLYDSADDGVLDLYQDNAVNHRIHGNGATVFNELGTAVNDFRMESDTRPYLFWLDASANVIRFGNNDTAGYAENGNTRTVNSLSTTINYVADFELGGNNRDTTVGIGSTEFLHDAGNLYVMLHGRLLPYDDNARSLGTSNWRWQSLWAVDGTINTSDLRQKKNIKPLEYGLDKLMQVETITYKWKDATNQATKIGFSAQNLLETIPEVVVTEESVTIDEETGAEEMRPVTNLGVYYSDIIPVTVKAIQELNTKVETLEAENKNLKQQLSKLEQLEARLLALEENTNTTED